MEAANEAKRLAPLEPRAARLEEAVGAAGQELERVQREVTLHQQAIRRGWARPRQESVAGGMVQDVASLSPHNRHNPPSPAPPQGAAD